MSDPKGLTPFTGGVHAGQGEKKPRARCGSTPATISSSRSMPSTPASPRRASRPTARILRGHKMAAQRIAKGQPVLKFGQIIGFATEDIAAGRPHPHPQLLVCRVRARLCLCPGRARGDAAAGRAARHLRGLPPRQRQGRHAQLHRHPHQRELLGLGRALHGRGGQSLRHPRRIPQCRRRRLVRARHRLRARRQGRGLRGARAHAVGLCRPRQPRRRADRGPGLRGVPDRAPQEASTA